MGIIITPQLVETTKIGLRRVFLNDLKEPEHLYNRFFNSEETVLPLEQELVMAGFGNIQPWNAEDGDPENDAPLEGSRVNYAYQEYAMWWGISHRMFLDDIYKKVGRDLASSAALACRHTFDTLATLVLVNGAGTQPQNKFGNNVATGYDGQNLFSTAHPRLDGGAAQSNMFTVPAALTASTLQAALLLGDTWLNNRGQPVMSTPARLIVAPSQKYSANELLHSTTVVSKVGDTGVLTGPATASTGYENVLRGVVPEIVNNKYLSALGYGGSWFLQYDKHYMQWLWREHPEYTASMKENLSMYNLVHFGMTYGWTDWYGIIEGFIHA